MDQANAYDRTRPCQWRQWLSRDRLDARRHPSPAASRLEPNAPQHVRPQAVPGEVVATVTLEALDLDGAHLGALRPRAAAQRRGQVGCHPAGPFEQGLDYFNIAADPAGKWGGDNLVA